MRVINDKEEKSQVAPLDLSKLILNSLLCGIAFSGFVFAPLPIILTTRDSEGVWAKVIPVLGAVLAILLFEAPAPVVVLSFIYGMFVADAVERSIGLWSLLGQVTILVLSILGAVLGLTAFFEKVHPMQVWHNQIDSLVGYLKSGSGEGVLLVDWQKFAELIKVEGMGLILAGILLATWISIGFAAHLKWVDGKNLFSAENLRRVRLPKFIAPTFILCIGFSLLEIPFGGVAVIRPLQRIVGVLLFIQGGIHLSEILEYRKVKSWIRTLVFMVSVTLGFYVLIGMGMMTPFLEKRRRDESYST